MKSIHVQWLLLAALALAVGAAAASCGATDNGGGSDADSDTDGDSDGDADTSVYDVRQGAVAVNEVVTLAGIIVTTPTLIDDADGSATVYVEEPDAGPWSGIAVYMYSDVALAVTLDRGDVVTVTGQYQEFYGLSEIVVSAATDVEITGTADVPAPEVVLPADVCTGGADAEAYESVIVSVEGVAVTADPDTYGQWQVDGTLLVADTFFAEAGGPSGSNIEVGSGDIFDAVHGVLEFSYDEFKLSPRDTDDYVGWSGGDSDTDTDSDVDVTIYELQQGEIAGGTDVVVTEVVVTSPLTFDDAGFFVEEAEGGEYSGIYVFNYNAATDPVTVAVGDLVTISGTYDEFYENSEIEISGSAAVTNLGTAAVPAPVVIADPTTIATDGADAEAYESVLVTVNDVTVTTEVDSFGQIVVDDSLLIGSVFLDAFLEPTNGTTYASVTGPLFFTFSNSVLEPRTLADVVE